MSRCCSCSLTRLQRSGFFLALVACGSEGNGATATEELMGAAPTIFVDLDPSSSGTTVTVESLTASANMQLFFADRESGNVLALDSEAPAPAVVGRIEDRTDTQTNVPIRGNGAGMVFTAQGDLLIASASFGEILRLTGDELASGSPAVARPFITRVQGANSVLLTGDTLFISGGNTGNIYSAPATGGEAHIWSSIPAFTRAVAPDGFMQSVVANGLALAADGALLVADTARAALWRIPMNADGSARAPETVASSELLQGLDGITVDPQGRLWGTANERNALVVIDGSDVRDAFKNDNAGPLEFPAALVFIGNVGYVANYDRPRGDNLAADGTTSSAGVGASIARFPLGPESRDGVAYDF
jgi:sugar lactone lactonase YvrE